MRTMTLTKDNLVERWLERAELLADTNPELALGLEICAVELLAVDLMAKKAKADVLARCDRKYEEFASQLGERGE